MANPEKSGSAYAQVYGLYKLYGWDGLKKLIDNAKILDSSSLIYKGVAAGEYPLGITMEYAAHRYIVGGDKNVGIIYPADGAFMAPEATGIVKNCPHPAEAKKFVDYLISKTGGGRDLRQILPPAGPARRGGRGRAALPEKDPASEELRSHGGQHAGKGDPEEVEGDGPFPISPMRVHLTGITKRFGPLQAVDDVEPHHRGGGVLHPPRPERLRQDDAPAGSSPVSTSPTPARSVSGTGSSTDSAHQRETGMVFQNYALFPHLTVFDNVAYGLKARKVPRGNRRPGRNDPRERPARRPGRPARQASSAAVSSSGSRLPGRW